MKTVKTHFDEGMVTLTLEDDGRIHCVGCDKILDVTLADIDGIGSAPVCKDCAGVNDREAMPENAEAEMMEWVKANVK